METAAQRSFWVGPWRVEPRSLRVERGTDSHRLTPRAMAVLCCLAAAVREVVRKHELLGAVWGDAVVTEDALTQCIVELRKALGDSARRSSVIETIPRIGFRLIAPIDRSVASLEPRLRWRLRLAVLAAALLTARLYFGQRFYALREPAPIDAVAVLPFENLSGDPAMRYFSDGLAEGLLDSLADVPGLRVPARTPLVRVSRCEPRRQGTGVATRCRHDGRRVCAPAGTAPAGDGPAHRSGQRHTSLVRGIRG